MGPAVKYRWGGWGPAGGDQPETPGHLGQDQGSGSWPLPLSSGPPWPTAASRGTDREGGPVPITSPHHSEEPSRGIQKSPVCSCFCVLRSSARPGGLGPVQDLRARGVRLCHAGWSFPVIPRDVATSPREAPGAGGGKGAGEWPHLSREGPRGLQGSEGLPPLSPDTMGTPASGRAVGAAWQGEGQSPGGDRAAESQLVGCSGRTEEAGESVLGRGQLRAPGRGQQAVRPPEEGPRPCLTGHTRSTARCQLPR